MLLLPSIRIAVFCATLLSVSTGFAQTPTPQPPLKELKIRDLSFSGQVADEKDVFAINLERAPTQFLKIGEAILDTGYTIIAYDAQTKPPTLLLEHTATHEKFKLTQRFPTLHVP